MLQNKSNEKDLKQEETIQENPCKEEVTENEVEQNEIIEVVKTEVDDTQKESKKIEKDLDIDAMIKSFDEELDVGKKISLALEYLQEMLSHKKGPYLNEFWDFRSKVVDLFEKEIDIEIREKLWQNLDKVTSEAKHLKQIEDDQAAFAAEQIDIAVKSMEDNLNDLPSQVESAADFILDCKSDVINNNKGLYSKVQKELNLLNAYAGRINSLRKELIKTDMRIGRKNKFFKRLSIAGDKIFPRRKELIKEVSTAFIDDIKVFVEQNFSSETFNKALFKLRNEVKFLQHIAKVLTLNTHAFTVTRKKLSDCWDILRESEKVIKKEQQDLKEKYQPIVDEVLAKIEDYKNRLTVENLSASQCGKAINEISSYMRSVELGYEQVKFLRNKLNDLWDDIKSKEESEEQERRKHQESIRQERQERFNDIKNRIDSFIENSAELDIDAIKLERENLQQEIKSSEFIKSEQMQLERGLHSIRDIINEKREKALFSLSDDDRNAIEQLQDLLEQKIESRNDIRSELDKYKKIKSGSGLDFDKAIMYSEMIEEEQERFDKANESIKNIEEKIEELKNRA